ncbi:MAG: DNA-directed RNA polymerase subunit beta' [candidate division WS1 bacterium]|nr:DNA-directed RNA polymerase subunit beta' [candidate division WS1 bacterium]
MAQSTTDFDTITIGLASPEEIRSWSYGEVKKPETINYRTYRPERDGLFCERIFGPTRDWECHCGKYKKVKFKGIICDRCGVEVTRSKVRRERMGHIELASPVCHSWYLKGVPSPISLLLDMSRRLLEEVVYFASYIVTSVNVEKLQQYRRDILEAADEEKSELRRQLDSTITQLQERYELGLQDDAEAAADVEDSGQRPASADEASDDVDLATDEEEDLEDDDELEDLQNDLDEELSETEDEPSYDEVPFFAFENDADPGPISKEDLSRQIRTHTEGTEARITQLDQAAELLFELQPKQLISEMEHRALNELLAVCEVRLDGDFVDLFQAGLGAAAIEEILSQIDLDELALELRKEIDERRGARRARAVKRLGVVEAFRNSKNRPEWMILEALPVLPPELRPMVQLDGGRFATSDLNDLYRRVINRNNRLRRIIDINAPESIVNHERRLLQEAVDALIDNSRRSRPVTGSNRRPLKSLSDMLKGKEGRFRKNLLGKRVDYSGRSVIVVGPELHLHQCGLPREMALELFKPFVMNRLVQRDHTKNIKVAKKMVDRLQPEVWDALDDVIADHPVMLNRAPTLHRLGIQAFEPVLIDGKAIQLHPLVCEAFNADFDGDQMAVHVPLSAYAQAEARLLMLSSRNLFKPADGSPVCAPKYDVVLGCYYMTQQNPEAPGSGRYFPTAEAVITAYQHRQIDLHATIQARVAQIYLRATDENGKSMELDPQLSLDIRRIMTEVVADEHPPRPREVSFTLTEEAMEEEDDTPWDLWFSPLPGTPRMPDERNEAALLSIKRRLVNACRGGYFPLGATVVLGLKRELIDTSVGRVIFNHYLPLDMRFVNCDVARDELGKLVRQCYDIYGQARTAELLDIIKSLGFQFATRSGLSICVSDTDVPTDRAKILAETEKKVAATNSAQEAGQIVEEEREEIVLQLWETAKEQVADNIFSNIGSFNPLWMMMSSGARANRSHISQISGMRGLMSDPFGRLIEALPVKSNFHEGLDVLEYFVSTHGARKGLADTALRTADAGYLTRRLVDVAQAVMISEEDCGTREGILVTPLYEVDLHCPDCGEADVYREGKCRQCGHALPTNYNNELLEDLPERIIGRTAAQDVVHPEDGHVIVAAGNEISDREAAIVQAAGVRHVWLRSALTCECRDGICIKCYGRDMSTQRPVEIGTAVGIIAAQSIGEPGTQLTMRTFHTGGVAGETITAVADVKKRKQQALRSLHGDVGSGRVSLEVAGTGRARQKAIKEMLKVLESSVHGLLRVVELFEARTPKGQAITAEVDGVVAEVEHIGFRRVIIHSQHSLDDLTAIRGQQLAEDVYAPDGKTLLAKQGGKLLKKTRQQLRKAGITHVKIATAHLVPPRGDLYVQPASEVRAGDPLTAGPLDAQGILEKRGISSVQEYLLKEVQKVYRPHGVGINDKHIEIIVRQMLLRRKIVDHGDTKFLPGQIVDRFDFEEENRRVRDLGGREATARPQLLGITQASLATDSFLSAASFQRTTRVLGDAACEYKSDPLEGVKENVIIGRLIPAGTGMKSHRSLGIASAEGHELETEEKSSRMSPEVEVAQRLQAEFSVDDRP